jgi:5,5'-dehydrodivanillate O-demethylase oxygenase subunit
MLTHAENEQLTSVGPGTPAGELLRRYWHPVAMLPELGDAAPTKHVRLLGEDLVLFRDLRGRVGLLADHCSHRGASLLYGRVEERGIACAYHGWLYDTSGQCLETPAEPSESRFHLTVRQRAYPVEAYAGLYWAYLGPPPAPVLPRYDALETYPLKTVEDVPVFDCNWLQVVENTADQIHAFILHQNVGSNMEKPPGDVTLNTTRGQIDQLVSLDYWEAPFGISRRELRRNGYDLTNFIIFPMTLRIYNFFAIKVPIDDTHTRLYNVYVDAPDGPDAAIPSGDRPVEYLFPADAGDAKEPAMAVHPAARYRMDRLRFQDVMALETQGLIADRTAERLATSDRGVVLLRSMLWREIERVQRGVDPVGVVRDPNHEPIDTHFQNFVEVMVKYPRTGRAINPAVTA